jgi:hypothetical protein
VRKVLVEANLDTTALHISTTSGSVSIRGEFRKLTGHKMNDNAIAKLLVALEVNILRTKGVKRVAFKLERWNKRKGRWVKQDK